MSVYGLPRVFRGGFWRYDARYARCAPRALPGAEYRYRLDALYRDASLGVRLVMGLR